MDKDERDLLDVLKFELEFVEKGGYGRSPRQSWRFQYVFEDSPACMNYDSRNNPGPCSDCVLMQLVPPEFRGEEIPCRHIPLNAAGETLDSLYRYADQYEIEEKYKEWLRATIAKIEETRAELLGAAARPSAPGTGETIGEPLFYKLHPKCANPACPNAFHWMSGGKLFRFRSGSVDARSGDNERQSSTAAHGVKHYWLCEPCSQRFTLVCNGTQGAELKLLWPELAEGRTLKNLPAV